MNCHSNKKGDSKESIPRGEDSVRPSSVLANNDILAMLQYLYIEHNVLKAAMNTTTERRGLSAVVRDYHRIMDTVRSSEVMQKQWDNYQKDFEYATYIALEDACDTVYS